MEPLSKLFHKLIGKMIVLLALMLIELIILIHKLRPNKRVITTQQYLKFIEDKNPTICYTKRSEAEECRVCLLEFEEGQKVRNLKCKHTFHKECLDKWLQQFWATCPICRNQVLPNDVVSKHRINMLNNGNGSDDDHLPFILSGFRRRSTLDR